jgi:hypothetical protein
MSNTDVPTKAAVTNSIQTQVGASAVIAVAAGYAAGHGWLTLSLDDWKTLLTAFVTIAPILWPVIKTRAISLKDAVGRMHSTTVVTDPVSAKALASNKDVVAATPEIVAAIKKSN